MKKTFVIGLRCYDGYHGETSQPVVVIDGVETPEEARAEALDWCNNQLEAEASNGAKPLRLALLETGSDPVTVEELPVVRVG